MATSPYPDTLTEYFGLCKDSSGQLKEELIQYVIAAAYRAGFDECRMRIPHISMDHCPVRLPTWPVDETRIAALANELKAELDGRRQHQT